MKKGIFLPLAVFVLLFRFSLANLLQNANFDSWIDDSTPNNWVVEYRTYAGVNKETGTVHSTPFSAQLVRRQAGTGNNRGLRQRIPVTPGTSYTLWAWFYDNNDQADGGIVLTWRKADSSFIGSTGTVYTEDTAAWQHLTITAVAPNSPPDSVAAFVDVLLRTYGFTGSQPGGFIFVDDVDFDVSAINETKVNSSKSQEYFVGSPNPFTIRHQFKFLINQSISVRLLIYNNLGQMIRTFNLGTLTPGIYTLNWDGTKDDGLRTKAGIYFALLEKSGGKPEIKKIILKK